jgi:hypothetical protein
MHTKGNDYSTFLSIEHNPKLTTHQHSIYLDQTQNNLKKLFEHFTFICKIKI